MTHQHTGRCGDLHKFEGEPWADAALAATPAPPLHIVSKGLTFKPGGPGERDTFEVIGEDGNVEAIIYMAGRPSGAAGWHIVSANSWANS